MDRKKLGLRIRHRRAELNMKQVELAEAIKMKKQQLSRIEVGDASLKVDQLIEIARVLRSEPCHFLKGL